MYVIITHTYVSFVINNNIEFVLLSFLVCANLLLYGLCERSTFHMKKLLKNTIAAVAVILGIGLGLGIGQKNYVQAAQDTYSLSMAEDNKWYYYKNGVVDTGYTGLAYNDYGWFYVKDGTIDWGYTGLAYNENGWFYVNGGILDWSYTGLAYNENGWFYVNGGILDWSYTGLASNENGWFYINGGILDWSYTGLASNDYGWFYVSGGMLDWGYTGMAYNDYGWWYVVDGTLDYTYTGFGVNEYGSWLYCDGRIRFDYTGNARRGTTIYVIEAGRVTQTIEMQLNLSTDSEYYKYEYAYKTGDTSVLETDSEKAFYDGLSSYLDAAYAYATPYEQELAVHNYMVLNSEYDYYNYINGTIPYVSHTAEGIFVNRTAVCDGYSSAFKLCMDILGIPCEIITGEGDGVAHAWNVVMLDGEWYMVDVTWDDPVPDNPGVVNYDYFNITDEKMRRDHSYTSDINANGTKYNYYAQQENYFTNTTDYYEYLNKKLSEALESGVENATVVIYVESLDAPIDNEFRSAYTDYSKVTVKHHSLGTSSSYGSYVMRITWRLS